MQKKHILRQNTIFKRLIGSIFIMQYDNDGKYTVEAVKAFLVSSVGAS